MGTDIGNDFESYLKFLRQYSADKNPHSTGSLMDHLLGTCEILRQWDASHEICLAGLFHSVYGTESYVERLVGLNLRNDVAKLIGEDAELIAFLFGVMEKETFYDNLRLASKNRSVICRIDGKVLNISERQFIGLCHIILANWFEQRLRLPQKYHFMRKEEFKLMLPHLLPAAANDLTKMYGF